MTNLRAVIRDAEIEAQMRRIAASPAFAGAARSRQFLEFCVGRAMSGHAAELKETTIAVEVFLRTANYDPKVDPIVRVHARRVREKLELYYRTAGTDDPIRIDLPKGGYVPLILRSPTRPTTDPPNREEHQPTPPTPREAAPASGGRRFWFAIAVVTVALLGFAWIFPSASKWGSSPPITHSELSILKPWDSLTGRISDPAWSPDGSRLAFAAVAGNDPRSHVYLQQAAQDGQAASPPVRLTHDNQVELRPVWSPDGRRIAFVRQIDLNHFDIVCFDRSAGTEHLIGHFVTYWALPTDHPALDWSPDGRFLLTVEQSSPSNPVRLILISLVNGQRTFLTSPPDESSGDVDARFSPDSQWVTFRRGGLGDLYVVSIKGEQIQSAVPLTSDNKGVRGLAWIDHGRSILFGTQRGNTSAFGLWEIAKDGGTPQPVSPPDFDAADPAVSSTGAVVLVHRQVVDELVVHAVNAEGGERPLLLSGSVDSSPAYSPDGRQVAFVSTRSGWTELWLYRIGEPAPMQLTHFHGAGLIFLPSWAPDGKSIAFSLRQNGATNIFVDNLVAKTLRQITWTRKRDMAPVYSSNGSFLYFSSNADGTSRIWRIRADGSNRGEPLFLEAVTGFAPSADGKWLYFLRAGPRLVVARESLIDGTTEDLAHLPGDRTFVNDLAVAGNKVYVASSQSDMSTAEIFRMDPEAGTRQIVTRLRNLPSASVDGLTSFTVSPDGADMIVGQVRTNQSNLYLAALTH